MALYGGLWPYESWNGLNYLTEEVINPEITLKYAILLSMPCIILVYLFINISYFTVMTATELASQSAIAVAYSKAAIGDTFATFVPWLVCISAMGSFNGGVLHASRLIFASARDGNMPGWLCYISKSYKTPVVSIIFNACLSTIYLIPDSSNFDSLLDEFGFAQWLIYGCTFYALIYLRKTMPNAERPFRVWSIGPWVAMVAAFSLVIVPLVSNFGKQYFGIISVFIISYFCYEKLIVRELSLVSKVNDFVRHFLMGRFLLSDPIGEKLEM